MAFAGVADVTRLLAEIAAGVRAAAASAEHSSAALDRLIKQHFGDRVKSEPWIVFAETALAASTTATVVTLTPPRSQSGIVLQWGICVESAIIGRDGWASSLASADGLVFDVLRGGVPMPWLNSILAPPGGIGTMGPIWLPFYPDQPLVVRARNLDAVNSYTAAVQLAGVWDETSLGRRG